MTVQPVNSRSYSSWSNFDFFQMNECLDKENALNYFCQHSNPFYDRNCINEQIKVQRLIEAAACNFTGIEFVLASYQEPSLYVIRKQMRSSPTATINIGMYIIISPGIVYPLPDLYTYVTTRLGALSAILRSGIEDYLQQNENLLDEDRLANNTSIVESGAQADISDISDIDDEIDQAIALLDERPAIKTAIEIANSSRMPHPTQILPRHEN
ncbi:hypothetical protein GJ496_002214 [Pomphorhynchus laevis]|nr:hypothetical protein GJ496_002214 [Pomphorhynchus laevis]